MTWKPFPYYWYFVRAIQRSPVASHARGSIRQSFDDLFVFALCKMWVGLIATRHFWHCIMYQKQYWHTKILLGVESVCVAHLTFKSLFRWCLRQFKSRLTSVIDIILMNSTVNKSHNILDIIITVMLNEHHGVSNHRHLKYFLIRLLRRTSWKET